MVCNETNGYIIHGIDLVGFATELTYLIPDCLHGINIKYGIHILHHNCKTFKSHTGINVLILQLFVSTFAISVELSKYIVPYFHKAVALTANFTARISTSVFFSAVIINLGTRSTRSCTMLPEVVAFSGYRVTVKTGNLLCRNPNLFGPDFKRFIILSVNRWIKTILLKAKDLG